MSREIKFRFWNIERKRMVHDVFIADALSNWFLKNKTHYHIMQSTGIKDKNGNEIYEGEKCMCRMNGIETHIEEVETEVIYDLTVGAFCHRVTTKDSDYKWFGLNSKNLLSCEIIGNIYQTNQIV